jgi:hypothetical protein
MAGQKPVDNHCLVMFNFVWLLPNLPGTCSLRSLTIATDKGKPVVRQGRKAVSLGSK